jgi:signal transduction histidine kinase
MNRTIRWRLVSGSLAAITLPLFLLAFVLGWQLWDFHLRELQQDLASKARVIAATLAPNLDAAARRRAQTRRSLRPPEIDRVVATWREHSPLRVTVADTSAVVLASTALPPGSRLDDRHQPGVRAALGGRLNSMRWKSPNHGYEDTMYVNAPVEGRGGVVGAVRVSYSLAQIQSGVQRIGLTFLVTMALYGCCLVSLAFAQADRIARPVEELTTGAQRFARGELEASVAEEGPREVAELGRTLNQMAGRLRMLEGARRQYVANVSHELRTPLASIRGMAETLLAHGGHDPALRLRYLPRILHQTDRLGRLASQLLDLTQVESGALATRMTSVALGQVIREAVETCRPSAETKAIDLRVEVANALPWMVGDEDWLIQLFQNLLDNAIRYTPSEGTVSVWCRAEGHHLVVTVKDTGPGIAPEHLPRLVEPFYREDRGRSRVEGGAGLGLPLADAIARAHEGSLTIDSEVGRGTWCTVRLPTRGHQIGERGAADSHARRQ